MNIPKDIAKLIGSYSHPTVWEVRIAKYISDPNYIEKHYFFAETFDQVCKHLLNSNQFLLEIYDVIYTLYKNYIFYFPDENRFRRMENSYNYMSLNDIKELIYSTNFEEKKKLLEASLKTFGTGIKVEKLSNIVSLY